MAKRRPSGQGTLFKRTKNGSWIVSWYDHAGKRRERSTRTTDRRAAERILAKYVADAALRREGVIDPRKDRFAIENRRPLVEHVSDYITHCQNAGHAARQISQKFTNLNHLISAGSLARLSDLTADVLERHLSELRESGLSARTVNYRRQIAVALMNWCKQFGRIESNPLTIVSKMDERKDCRRKRRPLTDAELVRLLAVAENRGRKLWYLTAALAGLRRGDLQQLTWTDVNFSDNTLTIRQGKAKREDIIPLHPQLAEEFKRKWQERKPLPKTKVFSPVTNMKRLKDFLAAGLAYEEIVTDSNGNPIMTGKQNPRPKTRIVTQDEDGYVVDLHALRTTLGTNLTRAGVQPQLAQKILRHADYRTTLRHYTVLGLNDTLKAINRLPDIEQPKREAATGTCDKKPQQYPQQLGHETVQKAAEQCESRDINSQCAIKHKSLFQAKICDSLQGNTNPYKKASGQNRTDNPPLTRRKLYR